MAVPTSVSHDSPGGFSLGRSLQSLFTFLPSGSENVKSAKMQMVPSSASENKDIEEFSLSEHFHHKRKHIDQIEDANTRPGRQRRIKASMMPEQEQQSAFLELLDRHQDAIFECHLVDSYLLLELYLILKKAGIHPSLCKDNDFYSALWLAFINDEDAVLQASLEIMTLRGVISAGEWLTFDHPRKLLDIHKKQHTILINEMMEFWAKLDYNSHVSRTKLAHTWNEFAKNFPSHWLLRLNRSESDLVHSCPPWVFRRQESGHSGGHIGKS